MFESHHASRRISGTVRKAGIASFAVLMAFAAPAAAEPSIAVEVETGRVIEHHDAFQRWYPASLTKLMTAYVTLKAIREGKLGFDSLVTMTAEASRQPPSKMYFAAGTRFTVDSAFKYLMVKSANDIALALAQRVGGNADLFVDMMNAEALKLGMTSTRFINPNGLPGEGQYTDARDMALLAVALKRQFPEFTKYTSLEGFTVGKASYENYNMLISRYAGADGMKTGYICASGYNQVSSAMRNGREVVSVILGASGQVARAEESARLLEAAFSAPAGNETLLTLAPYGDGRDQVADVSDQMCSEAARKAFAAEHDEKGNLVFTSPLIRKPDHATVFTQAPVASPLGNGPATAIEAAQLLGTSFIPLPDYKPAM